MKRIDSGLPSVPKQLIKDGVAPSATPAAGGATTGAKASGLEQHAERTRDSFEPFGKQLGGLRDLLGAGRPGGSPPLTQEQGELGSGGAAGHGPDLDPHGGPVGSNPPEPVLPHLGKSGGPPGLLGGIGARATGVPPETTPAGGSGGGGSTPTGDGGSRRSVGNLGVRATSTPVTPSGPEGGTGGSTPTGDGGRRGTSVDPNAGGTSLGGPVTDILGRVGGGPVTDILRRVGGGLTVNPGEPQSVRLGGGKIGDPPRLPGHVNPGDEGPLRGGTQPGPGPVRMPGASGLVGDLAGDPAPDKLPKP